MDLSGCWVAPAGFQSLIDLTGHPIDGGSAEYTGAEANRVLDDRRGGRVEGAALPVPAPDSPAYAL